MRRLSALLLSLLSPAFALGLNNNDAIVDDSVQTLAALPCGGHSKVDSCIKLVGSLTVTTGEGEPSVYSIDELGFSRIGTASNCITPKSFTGSGVPSLGVSPTNDSSVTCDVLDANPGAAGALTYTCEMSLTACNALYAYEFVASHDTSGLAEHSSNNATHSTAFAYTAPCPLARRR